MANIGFDYFYGREGDAFTFYRVPKLLFTDERFKGLSCEAKLAYGLMLDRMGLSLRNQWLDEDGKVYIIFHAEELAELLGCSRAKIFALMGELDSAGGVGLIERKRFGLGKPSRIYVKNIFVIKDGEEEAEGTPDPEEDTGIPVVTGPELQEEMGITDPDESAVSGNNDLLEEAESGNTAPESGNTVLKNGNTGPENGNKNDEMLPDFQKSKIWTSGSMDTVTTNLPQNGNNPVTGNTQKSKFWTSRSLNSGHQEVQNLDTNDTEYSDTEYSDTENKINIKAGSKAVTSHQSYPSYQDPVTTSASDDPLEKAEADVRDRIEYNTLILSRPRDKDRIDEIVYALAEVEISGQSTYRISGDRIRASTVKNRLRKIDAEMVEYVLECQDESPTLIRNPKKYLLKCLYDAPTTIGTYYANRARVDMMGNGG
ncbi:MAG: replication initiator protein A [Lachnospiraceae bacterium]|nr:replication initiator protein A [Lachnospiraceae bacterium]